MAFLFLCLQLDHFQHTAIQWSHVTLALWKKNKKKSDANYKRVKTERKYEENYKSLFK